MRYKIANKNILVLLDPEDNGTALFRAFGKYLSDNRAISEDLNFY
jgi:5S rRNA maturation endonuclease (ribonuclease M5)